MQCTFCNLLLSKLLRLLQLVLRERLHMACI